MASSGARWFAAVAGLGVACAPVRPGLLAERDRSRLGPVAVATASFEPEVRAGALGRSQGDEVGSSAVRGMLACGEIVRSGQTTSPTLGAIGIVVGLVCLPFGAAIGATAGAATSKAPAASSIEETRARAQQAIDASGLQQRVAEAAQAYGRDMGLTLGALPRAQERASADDRPAYQAARGEAGTVIEIGVLSVEASTRTIRGEVLVYLEMKARVRVVDVRAGRDVDTFEVRYTSPARGLAWWLVSDAQVTRAELDRATAHLAEQAIDEALLVYLPSADRARASPPPKAGARVCEEGSSRCVPPYALRDIDPPVSAHCTWANRPAYPLSDHQPTFRWEAFPRGLDVVPGDRPGQAQQVRYDLRLLGRGGIAYERRGLTLPEHRLEEPLEPCQHFRWTVRARFVLNGAPRVTEWTGTFDFPTGDVAPWWWRRGSVPALASVPDRVEAFYLSVKTPAAGGAACPKG